MALNGLGRYADAIFVLRQLVSREPEDQAAQHALAECQMLQEQAFMGKYDMPALLFGRLATSFRRCADYVGPISVAYLGEGAGRGVVTIKRRNCEGKTPLREAGTTRSRGHEAA